MKNKTYVIAFGMEYGKHIPDKTFENCSFVEVRDEAMKIAGECHRCLGFTIAEGQKEWHYTADGKWIG